MRIFIPSRGRADQLTSTFCPIHQMPDHWRERTVFIVPQDEVDDYRSRGINASGTIVNGIAKVRHSIGDYCRSMSIEKFLMVDDDVKWFRRRDELVTNLVPATTVDVNAMLMYVEMALDLYAHVGISAREGNNRIDVGDAAQATAFNTRTLRALAYRTEQFMDVEHGRVDVMEDFDVNLQLLERGWSNVNLGYWSQDQRGTQTKGGCSDYRTHELHEKSARRLAELHPGLVSLRQKQNKTGGEFGTRTEVTIQWKKAFEQGRKNYADNRGE